MSSEKAGDKKKKRGIISYLREIYNYPYPLSRLEQNSWVFIQSCLSILNDSIAYPLDEKKSSWYSMKEIEFVQKDQGSTVVPSVVYTEFSSNKCKP